MIWAVGILIVLILFIVVDVLDERESRKFYHEYWKEQIERSALQDEEQMNIIEHPNKGEWVE